MLVALVQKQTQLDGSFLQCAAVRAALTLKTLSYRGKYVSASMPPFDRPGRLV